MLPLYTPLRCELRLRAMPSRNGLVIVDSSPPL